MYRLTIFDHSGGFVAEFGRLTLDKLDYYIREYEGYLFQCAILDKNPGPSRLQSLEPFVYDGPISCDGLRMAY